MLTIIMICGKLIGYYYLINDKTNYVDISPSEEPTYTILIFDELTPVFLLFLIFITLMVHLRKFHYFEY